MKKRNPFSDLGMVVAISVFICILIKSLLFGFTWGSIVWIIITCAYFFVSAKYDSDSKLVKQSTRAFLILSVLTAVTMALFDRKAMPKMHAFEGTGDTIQDEQIVDMGPKVTMYEVLPEDTVAQETDSLTEEQEVTMDDFIDLEAPAEETEMVNDTTHMNIN